MVGKLTGYINGADGQVGTVTARSQIVRAIPGVHGHLAMYQGALAREAVLLLVGEISLPRCARVGFPLLTFTPSLGTAEAAAAAAAPTRADTQMMANAMSRRIAPQERIRAIAVTHPATRLTGVARIFRRQSAATAAPMREAAARLFRAARGQMVMRRVARAQGAPPTMQLNAAVACVIMMSQPPISR